MINCQISPSSLTMAAVGWECGRCTFYHHAPGTRCVMCNELRVSKQQMLDFIQGKRHSTTCVTNPSEPRNANIHNPYKKKPRIAPCAGGLSSNPSQSCEDQKLVSLQTTDAACVNSIQQPTTTNEHNTQTMGSVRSLMQPAQTKVIESSPNCTLSNPFSIARLKPSTAVYEPGPVPLCEETMHEWIYPVLVNFPIRQYQRQISETAIFSNTLVSLPTGLGKTLIAAVVLYNYYRWFPQGKIVFMAPTLPLVNQQVKACYDIMGIPAEDTAILTGKVKAGDRERFWTERRVFFCTPQTVQKDLEARRCIPQQLVCLVLDEAHKASGDYAYTQVVQLLDKEGAKFRLVGLSATPGTNIKAIQRVVDTLAINRIEARFDDDLDVKKHMHERHSEIVVVKNSTVATSVEQKLNALIGPLLDTLRQAGALARISGNSTVVPYNIIQAREHYLKNNNGIDHRILGCFAAAQKFVQCRADLRTHGIGVLRNRLLRLKNEPNRGVLAAIVKSDEFEAIYEEISNSSFDPDSSQAASLDRKINNPKLSKLDDILTEHFERSRACGESSRAIVFSQWRESVSEIVDVLSMSRPLLRPRHFVGQGKATRGKKEKGTEQQPESATLVGMKQSEQQQVIREFREGIHNILVCTCIGEEGLDIGEVDLIVNYDTLRSPIRMIQRTGRTGRKRDGRVVCLVSEGQEERTYNQSKQAEVTLGRALKNASAFKLHPNRPMFPQNPRCVEKDMSVKIGFHLSQVGGHITSTKLVREVNSAPGVADRVCWQLSAEEEHRRAVHLGPVGQLQPVSNLLTLPRSALRGFLGRRNVSLSTNSLASSGTMGLTRKLLHGFEARYCEQHKQMTAYPSSNAGSRRNGAADSFPLLYFQNSSSTEKPGSQGSPLIHQPNHANIDGKLKPQSVAVVGSPPRFAASTSDFNLRTPSDSSSCTDVDGSDDESSVIPNVTDECTGCLTKGTKPSNLAQKKQFKPSDARSPERSAMVAVLPDSPAMQLPSQEDSSDDESHLNHGERDIHVSPIHFDGSADKENYPVGSLSKDVAEHFLGPDLANQNHVGVTKNSNILSPKYHFNPRTNGKQLSDRDDTFSSELVDTPDSNGITANPQNRLSSFSLTHSRDDFACAICCSSDFEENDPIIFCDGLSGDKRCSLAVHRSCYEIPFQSINLTSWQCDLCKWKTQIGKSKPNLSCPKCRICFKTDGPLRQWSEDSWSHPTCNDTLNDVSQSHQMRSIVQTSKTESKPKNSHNNASKRTLQNLLETKSPHRRKHSLIDSDTDSVGSNKIEKRRRKISRLIKRRTGECYIDNEALIDTDEDVDGDEDESELLRIDQEEAIFAESFINDSSQLGSTQDELDMVDPDASIPHHRDVDAERERANLFATPLLNRRMLQSDSSGTRRRLSTSDPGLGKMHFIRSVLEHLRQGGDEDDIENFYQQVGKDVEEEEGLQETRSRTVPPVKPAVLKYIASDSEDE